MVEPLELDTELPEDHDWVHTPLFAVPLRDKAQEYGNVLQVVMKPWEDPDCQDVRMQLWLDFIDEHVGL